MNNWYVENLVAQEQRNDQLREAELSRQIAALRAPRRGLTVFMWRMLAKIGAWLMQIGCRIQTRYEHLVAQASTPALVAEGEGACS